MAFDLVKMTGVLERIKTPLTLAGLALLIFYGIFSKVLVRHIQQSARAWILGTSPRRAAPQR